MTDQTKRVPVEPTPAMVECGYRANTVLLSYDMVRTIYKAMLAAAPPIEPSAAGQNILSKLPVAKDVPLPEFDSLAGDETVENAAPDSGFPLLWNVWCMGAEEKDEEWQEQWRQLMQAIELALLDAGYKPNAAPGSGGQNGTTTHSNECPADEHCREAAPTPRTCACCNEDCHFIRKELESKNAALHHQLYDFRATMADAAAENSSLRGDHAELVKRLLNPANQFLFDSAVSDIGWKLLREAAVALGGRP